MGLSPRERHNMTTPITIQCKSCEKSLNVPASLIGKTGQCPACKAEIKFASPELPMISFRCHSCGKAYKVKLEHAGKTIKCPGCKVPVVLPTGMSPVTLPRAPTPLPKPALVKQGPNVALVLTAVLFGLPLLACGGCLGLALVFAPSKEVRERMRVEQEARNAEVAKTTEAAEKQNQSQAIDEKKNNLSQTDPFLRTIRGATWFGTRSSEQYQKLLSMVIHGDNEAFSKALIGLISAGDAVMFKDGEEVFLRPSFSLLLIKVRRKGDTAEYWTDSSAF